MKLPEKDKKRITRRKKYWKVKLKSLLFVESDYWKHWNVTHKNKIKIIQKHTQKIEVGYILKIKMMKTVVICSLIDLARWYDEENMQLRTKNHNSSTILEKHFWIKHRSEEKFVELLDQTRYR